MPRLLIALCLVILIAGCSGAQTEAPPDPAALMTQATSNVMQIGALRMIVERTGADYVMQTDIGNAIFNRIEAQYVAPNKIQATANVTLNGLPVEIEIFARDDDQWWRVIGTPWLKTTFLQGFNPRSLMQDEDRGLRAALKALENIQFIGNEQMEDGTAVYHLRSTADGAVVSWLMLYLVQMTGQVEVNAYIDQAQTLPAKFIIVQPETATESEEATIWTMELYDFNANIQLDEPQTAATATPAS